MKRSLQTGLIAALVLASLVAVSGARGATRNIQRVLCPAADASGTMTKCSSPVRGTCRKAHGNWVVTARHVPTVDQSAESNGSATTVTRIFIGMVARPGIQATGGIPRQIAAHSWRAAFPPMTVQRRWGSIMLMYGDGHTVYIYDRCHRR